MKLDERARIARTRVMEQLDVVATPSAGEVVRRVRVRHRVRLAGIVALGVVLTVAPIALRRSSTPTTVRVAAPLQDPPAGSLTNGAWAAVPKGTAGLGTNASLEALATTESAFIAGGDGLWRSSDGLHWVSVAPPAFSGQVEAIGTHDHDVIVIVATTTNPNLVLRSSDDARTWTVAGGGADAFGAAAPSMGRPSVTSLRWSDAGFWIAGGGASDGYAGIWISPDATQWESVLASGNGAGSVDIVDDGQGGLLAYFLRQAWSSSDGRLWTPVTVTVPAPYALSVVAPGASLAVGVNPAASHTAPTALLRSSDHGRTWTEDRDFHVDYPLAVGWGISRDGAGWVIAGFAGDPNHVDAWLSPDTTNWQSMPEPFKRTPGGTLRLIASIGPTTVIMGSAPELDRFFVVDHRVNAPVPTNTGACPGSLPRRLVDGTVAGADGLPFIDNATTNRASVEQTLASAEAQLRDLYPAMTRAEVGPGFGAAWQGQNGGQTEVVNVDDFAIIVHLSSAAACPQGTALYNALDGTPVFFVVDR
jgi:hypothetical protein